MEERKYITKLSEKICCDRVLEAVFNEGIREMYLISYEKALYEQIIALIDGLSEPASSVARMAWVERKEKKEICSALGISPEVADTYKAKAIRMLRHPTRASVLWSFVTELNDDLRENERIWKYYS